MERNQDPLVVFLVAIGTDPRIGTTHIALYVALYYLWLAQGCHGPLAINSALVMPLAKIRSLTTYHKTILELNEYGYIRYRSLPGRKASKVFFDR